MGENRRRLSSRQPEAVAEKTGKCSLYRARVVTREGHTELNHVSYRPGQCQNAKSTGNGAGSKQAFFKRKSFQLVDKETKAHKPKTK